MEITNTCQFRVTMLGYNREDYHDEVYCTDVNYRVNKWTNYHNNLNDPSSRIAGIRVLSQSYTSAKDSSDGMCHAVMVLRCLTIMSTSLLILLLRWLQKISGMEAI